MGDVLFPVGEAARKVLSLIEENFKSQNITVEIAVTGAPQIFGHPNEYGQVLLNILTNARDVLLERGVKEPRIEIRAWEEEGRSVLTIADNGGGIPEDILHKIFDPYFTTKELGKGTGVGLFMSAAICKIDRH